jgi:hypothetical protein
VQLDEDGLRCRHQAVGIKVVMAKANAHRAKQKSNVDDLERSFRTPAKPQP